MISFSFGRVQNHKITKVDEDELISLIKGNLGTFKGEIFQTLNGRGKDTNGVVESSKHNGFYTFGACSYLVLYDRSFTIIKEKSFNSEIYTILEDEEENVILLGNDLVLILDLNTWEVNHELKLLGEKNDYDYMSSLIKLSNGNYAVGRSDYHIYIINKQAKILHTIEHHTGNISKIIERDSFLVSAAFDKCIIYSDIKSYALKKTFTVNKIEIFDFIFLSDGRLVSTSNDVVISNLGKKLASLNFSKGVYSVIELKDHKLLCISGNMLYVLKEENQTLIIVKSIEFEDKPWKAHILWGFIIAVSFFEGKVVFLK